MFTWKLNLLDKQLITYQLCMMNFHICSRRCPAAIAASVTSLPAMWSPLPVTWLDWFNILWRTRLDTFWLSVSRECMFGFGLLENGTGTVFIGLGTEVSPHRLNCTGFAGLHTLESFVSLFLSHFWLDGWVLGICLDFCIDSGMCWLDSLEYIDDWEFIGLTLSVSLSIWTTRSTCNKEYMKKLQKNQKSVQLMHIGFAV